MSYNRKSCPVNKRLILNSDEFDKNDKNTYDGTETVRRLDRFDRKWFSEKSVAITFSSKTFYGRTFVVPYKDIDGIRYWFVDRVKKAKHEFYEQQNKAV